MAGLAMAFAASVARTAITPAARPGRWRWPAFALAVYHGVLLFNLCAQRYDTAVWARLNRLNDQIKASCPEPARRRGWYPLLGGLLRRLPARPEGPGGRLGLHQPTGRPGGPTRWGIDAATLGDWRKLGRPATAAEVQALGEPEADAIYRPRYYQAPGFHLIAPLSAPIAAELVDSGINLGTHWPSVWLQEDLNLCNRQGADYPTCR
jgi:hypothetical protein